MRARCTETGASVDWARRTALVPAPQRSGGLGRRPPNCGVLRRGRRRPESSGTRHLSERGPRPVGTRDCVPARVGRAHQLQLVERSHLERPPRLRRSAEGRRGWSRVRPRPTLLRPRLPLCPLSDRPPSRWRWDLELRGVSTPGDTPRRTQSRRYLYFHQIEGAIDGVTCRLPLLNARLQRLPTVRREAVVLPGWAAIAGFPPGFDQAVTLQPTKEWIDRTFPDDGQAPSP